MPNVGQDIGGSTKSQRAGTSCLMGLKAGEQKMLIEGDKCNNKSLKLLSIYSVLVVTVLRALQRISLLR